MKRFFVVGSVITAVLFLTVSLSEAQTKADWPKTANIGAAPVGGTYFVWAGGFAKLLHEKSG